MRKTLLLLAVSSTLAFTSANAAESSMRPGLWEVSTTSDLLALVPQISPENMEKLARVAKQYGFDMPRIQNGAAMSTTCISPAMANQNNFPDMYQNRAGCSATGTTHSGNKYRTEFNCNGTSLNGRGSAEGTFTTKETFAGRTAFRGTVQGNPIDEHADISGRWISASCGNVKSLK